MITTEEGKGSSWKQNKHSTPITWHEWEAHLLQLLHQAVILPAPAALQHAFQGPLLAPRQKRKAGTNFIFPSYSLQHGFNWLPFGYCQTHWWSPKSSLLSSSVPLNSVLLLLNNSKIHFKRNLRLRFLNYKMNVYNSLQSWSRHGVLFDKNKSTWEFAFQQAVKYSFNRHWTEPGILAPAYHSPIRYGSSVWGQINSTSNSQPTDQNRN